ncbi:MAG: EAL domain-containing protein [Armatimonadetes bacterium]|nr:EAL domain-containing protein [Armatimonadota bacterium]
MRPLVNNRILVIDDNLSIIEDYKKILCRSQENEELADLEASLFGTEKAPSKSVPEFVVSSATQGKDGYDLVVKSVEDREPFAVAFVDMRMPPGWDGLETIENLWKADPNLQVVLSSAFSDYSHDEILNRLGLTDKLIIIRKPFQPEEIVQLAVALSEKWSHHFDTSKAGASVGTTDPLTGLNSRSNLLEFVQYALNHRRAAAKPSALVLLDIDAFKLVNESLGRESGNLLIAQVSSRLRELLTKDETLARVGADEFALFIDDVTDTERVEASVRSLLDDFVYEFRISGQSIIVSLSAGIVVDTGSYESAEDLLFDAESALNQAKRSGKGRASVFDPQVRESALARLQLETGLRHVLSNGELDLDFQPIVSTLNLRIVGFEALLRWRRDGQVVAGPDVFVPLAEDMGLIDEIGCWAMEQAVRQQREFCDVLEHENLYMTINVSRHQLMSPYIADLLSGVLASNNVRPNRIGIEVTEGRVLEDVETAKRRLISLKDLGVQLFMDDFGSGYSSLNCLMQLPFDTVKIDRAFVARLGVDQEALPLVQGVIGLSHTLNKSVVVEGVENRSQLDVLRALRCDYVQGYLISKPLRDFDAIDFIRKWPEKQGSLHLAA